LPVSFKVPDISEWGYLLLIAVLGTGAQLAFSRPCKFVPTAEGSMVAPIYTAITVILSILFLGEVISPRFLIGALLVFAGMVYLIVREEFKMRKHVL